MISNPWNLKPTASLHLKDEKKHWLFRVYNIGDEKLPSFVGNISQKPLQGFSLANQYNGK